MPSLNELRIPFRATAQGMAIVAVLASSFVLPHAGHAQHQPFGPNDSDTVHSDAMAARYRILKADLYPSGGPPTCGASSATPSLECNNAVHNFCVGRGYVSGFGFGTEGTTDTMDVTCLTGDAVQVETYTRVNPGDTPGPTANEIRLNTWCLNTTTSFYSPPNHNCDIGINRQCTSDVGFGPISVVGNTLTYACIEPGVAEDQAVPSEVSAACPVSHGSEEIDDACQQAIAEHCADYGLVGGYPPAFSLSTAVDFSCLPEHETWTANSTMPLPPASPIDVLREEYELNGGGGIQQVFPSPHNRLTSSLSQTYDGRIAIGANGLGVHFQVQVPEFFSEPLGQAQTDTGLPEYFSSMDFTTQNLYETVENLRDVEATHLSFAPSIAVCDPPLAGSSSHHNRSQSHKGRSSNPQACTDGVLDPNGAQDCYDISLVARFTGPASFDDELWVTPVRLVVSNPKSSNPTALPTVADPIRLGDPERIEILGNNILEPVISGDGRLLIAQVNGLIMYSVIPDTLDACDPDGWTEFKHITEMYADPDMADYGIAKFPMRDTENKVISTALGDPLNVTPGAYPWIDRDGDMLFYIAGDQSFYYINELDQVVPRYPILGHPLGVSVTEPNITTISSDPFNGGRKIGLTAGGLWTQGKFFTLDTRNNNLDFSIHDNVIYHRLVDLYDDLSSGVEIGASEKTTLSSPENQFNFLPNLLTETPREVVWHLSSSKDTDEIAFDDVNHPAALIVSEMGATLNLVRDFFAPMSLHNRYNDGFEWDYLRQGTGTATYQGRGYTKAPHIANSAAAVSQEVADFAGDVHSPNPLAAAVTWNVPTYGRLLGGGRVEPLAAGGFQAKGLWLDGVDDRLEYVIPSQPDSAAMASAPWFVTLSVNPRSTTTVQRLITWPDGSFLNLVQEPTQQRLRLKWPTSTGYGGHDVILTDPLLKLATDKWSTISVLSEPNGSDFDVTVFLDGYNIHREEDITALSAFRIEPGRMMLSAQAGGFKGWVDDFKVIGGKPSVEEVCNHAGGTLVGVDSSASQELEDLADAYDAYGSHGRFISDISPLSTSYSEFACERPDTSSSPVCLGTTHGIMATECMRSLIHLQGIPLVWNDPRPDSVSNAFCLSCHTAENPSATMRPLDALTFDSGVEMHDDPRRQPVQPFPLLNGVIPQTYFPTPPPAGVPLENLDARTHPDVP